VTERRRSAVVIGASSGIGAETARVLAAAGLNVRVLGRRTAVLADLAREIDGSSATLDVTSESDVDTVLGQAAAELDGVDVSVYVAGTIEIRQIKHHPLDVWEHILSVNLTGAFLASRALIEHMRPGGKMLFVSSTAARKGYPMMAAYSASKGGLARFAESLGAEMERRGVGVHVIAPDQVATPMLDRPATADFQLEARQVADVIGWAAALPPDVVLDEVSLRAVKQGPFAVRRHTSDQRPNDKPQGS
jgi:NAD(P)-dependent dehydrogenase (short-subunit alcohol dehydrogenase family)